MDRQTDRHTHTEIDRHTDRQTHRHTDRKTHIQIDRQHTDTQTDIFNMFPHHNHTHEANPPVRPSPLIRMNTDKTRHTHTETHTQKHTHTETHTQKHTNTETHTQKHTHTHIYFSPVRPFLSKRMNIAAH
jgi:hypothetical protein